MAVFGVPEDSAGKRSPESWSPSAERGSIKVVGSGCIMQVYPKTKKENLTSSSRTSFSIARAVKNAIRDPGGNTKSLFIKKWNVV